MRRGAIAGGLVLLFFTAACADESLPVAANALAGGGAPAASNSQPILSGIDLLNQGDRFVSLTARASDPQNRSLTFRWQVSGGNLSSTTGRAVLWRVPTEAGTYTAALEVSNTAGGTVSGSQTFTVNPQGQITNQGAIDVQPVGLAVRQAAGTLGPAFAIPSPLNVAPNGSNVIQPNVFAAAPSPAPVLPPIFQPAATPAPALAPIIVPQQPIAAPTVTPPPPVIPPSPLPSPSPAPPAPGVPLRPVEEWRVYRDPARVLVPGGGNLTTLHFQSARRGWFAGGNRVLFYDRTSAQEPVLQPRSNGIPGLMSISRIRFADDNTGFVCGNQGRVYRTTDAGVTWVDVTPPGVSLSNVFQSMVVSNANVVTVCDTVGRAWRSVNAAGAVVSWEVVSTFPPDRPQDHPSIIYDGTGFRGDASLAFFAGNAIYRLDADAPVEADRWRRILELQAYRPAGTTDADGRVDYGDGAALQIRAASEGELWVTTQGGSLYRITNANTPTPTAVRFAPGRLRKREANQPGVVFLPNVSTGIPALAVTDPNNVFLGHFGIYDTNNAGVSWRAYPSLGFRVLAMQVDFSTEVDEAGRFRGWALQSSGDIYQYKIYN
ncbi:MAG: hypothetical protein VKN33_00160 [Candidatus Sericytochromatia bacterium]|nr:hypothetical protein [Candidatus Sericytochromatia bacterium]